MPVTAAAEAKRDYDLAHSTESFEYMSPWDRCITRGMPGGMFPGGYGNVYQIVQAPGYVAIVSEMIHETRIIPLDGRPRPNIRQWNGDSRGPLGGQYAGRGYDELQQQRLDRDKRCVQDASRASRKAKPCT